MKLSNYEMHLPQYSIGSDIYPHISTICKPYGTKAVVIGGHKGMQAAKEKLTAAAEESGIELLDFVLYGTDCTYEAVSKLKELPVLNEADMIFAVGGGKALDTCKCLADETGIPLFSFPTIASNCAACTSVSVMYNEDGSFQKPHFFLSPPRHAFIDTEILTAAPARYLWAGIGDTYAKYYEATISSRDEALSHYTALGVNISRMCLDPLVTYGPTAYRDNQSGVLSEALEKTVLSIVVTTAIASIFLTRDFTPDYNSGLAHAIFNSLTSHPVIEENHLHGEVVGFGVLLALLVDGQEEEFQKIYALNKELGLPLRLADIEISREAFEDDLARIPDLSDIRHYPYRVTPDMLTEALDRLDAMA